MSPQDERVLAELSLLSEMLMPTMSDREQSDFKDKIAGVKTDYVNALKVEADDKSSAIEKENAKKFRESLAKGLPDISKGVIAAIAAFQSGDNFAGSAAIMDICAAAAPIIAAMFDSAGPEGMIVGAMFSIVGQILRLFSPKQPSLTDQIADLLKEFDSEAQLVGMDAVALMLKEYDGNLTQACQLLSLPPAPLLDMPLVTLGDADEFEKKLEEVNLLLDDAVKQFSVAQFEDWMVAAWLKMPEKQAYPRWPEVLTAWCRCSADMINDRIKFICLADPKSLDDLIAFTRADGACLLPPEVKLSIHERLINLYARITTFRDEATRCNKIVLEVLEAVTPAVQAWGMHIVITTNHSLMFASGPSDLRNEKWTDRSDRNYYHRMAFVRPSGTSGDVKGYDLKPKYHCFLLKSDGYAFPGDPDFYSGKAHDWMDHVRVVPYTFDVDASSLIRDYPLFYDICAAQVTDDRVDCWVGVSDGVQQGLLYKKDNFNGPYSPGPMVATTPSPVDHVRAVYPLSASVLQDDPDKDAVDRHAVGLADTVIYGGLRTSGDLCVVAQGASHLVPTPWPGYNGIAANKNFVWVFNALGVACATHASILACIQKTRETPRWMTYGLPGRLQGRFTTDLNGNAISPDNPEASIYPDHGQHANRWIRDGDGGTPVIGEPALTGMSDLTACDDGTLTASIAYREAQRFYYSDYLVWSYNDTPYVYSTSYAVDVKAGTLSVDDSWPKIGSALRTCKMPVPCWPLVAAMKAKLELQSTATGPFRAMIN